jgi:hypothetical protein
MSKIIVVPFSFILNYFCTRYIVLFRTGCCRRSHGS